MTIDRTVYSSQCLLGSVADRAEGDRVPRPGERLPLDALTVGRGGHHVVTTLVDAYVVHVAVWVTIFVEKHQVTAPGPGLADAPELQELVFGRALDALAEVA